MLNEFLNMAGVSRHRIVVKEKIVSALGGFLGIFAILSVSYQLLDADTAVLIVPSMGASAVLLFAAPNSPFSQPWNVVGGHFLSAAIGVLCWKIIPDFSVAAAAGVGLAIGAMYLARCIHPPGGATALAAVIGGDKIHDLGFSYIFDPVILNTAVIFVVAVAFNSLVKWRQYPAHFPFRKKDPASSAQGYEPINHEDFVYALSQMDTFIDVTEEDLLKIYRLATGRHIENEISTDQEQG